ncbi:hypothetical protein, partial [Serratia marcescens]|uniref:hypothetical protein n=1 Tax=Serratia marcescens TaxID=615 RepID=UPI001BD2A392
RSPIRPLRSRPRKTNVIDMILKAKKPNSFQLKPSARSHRRKKKHSVNNPIIQRTNTCLRAVNH